MVKKFAEGTEVSVEKTRAEIEATLVKYGADKFFSGWERENAYIGFRKNLRFVKFMLPLPSASDKEFTRDPRHTWKQRSAEAAKKAYEAECRRRWRALLLAIKAKLEVVASGIASFDEEFLAHLVMPDNRPVADIIVHQLDGIYRGDTRSLALPAASGQVEDLG
jgi:hypothetical protein